MLNTKPQEEIQELYEQAKTIQNQLKNEEFILQKQLLLEKQESIQHKLTPKNLALQRKNSINRSSSNQKGNIFFDHLFDEDISISLSPKNGHILSNSPSIFEENEDDLSQKNNLNMQSYDKHSQLPACYCLQDTQKERNDQIHEESCSSYDSKEKENSSNGVQIQDFNNYLETQEDIQKFKQSKNTSIDSEELDDQVDRLNTLIESITVKVKKTVKENEDSKKPSTLYQSPQSYDVGYKSILNQFPLDKTQQNNNNNCGDVVETNVSEYSRCEDKDQLILKMQRDFQEIRHKLENAEIQIENLNLAIDDYKRRLKKYKNSHQILYQNQEIKLTLEIKEIQSEQAYSIYSHQGSLDNKLQLVLQYIQDHQNQLYQDSVITESDSQQRLEESINSISDQSSIYSRITKQSNMSSLTNINQFGSKKCSPVNNTISKMLLFPSSYQQLQNQQQDNNNYNNNQTKYGINMNNLNTSFNVQDGRKRNMTETSLPVSVSEKDKIQLKHRQNYQQQQQKPSKKIFSMNNLGSFIQNIASKLTTNKNETVQPISPAPNNNNQKQNQNQVLQKQLSSNTNNKQNSHNNYNTKYENNNIEQQSTLPTNSSINSKVIKRQQQIKSVGQFDYGQNFNFLSPNSQISYQQQSNSNNNNENSDKVFEQQKLFLSQNLINFRNKAQVKLSNEELIKLQKQLEEEISENSKEEQQEKLVKLIQQKTSVFDNIQIKNENLKFDTPIHHHNRTSSCKVDNNSHNILADLDNVNPFSFEDQMQIEEEEFQIDQYVKSQRKASNLY